MHLDELIRRRQDILRGRELYRREKVAEWLRDRLGRWLPSPTEALLYAAAAAFLADAILQILLLWRKMGSS